MAFLPNDLYSNLSNRASLPKIGFAQILYNCWTGKVTKFDPNSFYNWEQDNQPTYDLEERTYLAWEKLGYPTSAHTLVGINLVVSADAPDSVIGCNRNIYKTVSAAINAIPDYIDSPVLVEVCNFGNLGELVIQNKKFGPKGSLEIVNRAFADADPILSALPLGFMCSSIGPYALETLVSSLGTPYPQPFYFVSINGQINATSSVVLGSKLTSSTTDTRLNNNLSIFVNTLESLSNNRLSVGIWDKNSEYSVTSYPINADPIKFTPYELNAEAKDQIATHDVVPRSFDDAYSVPNNAANALAYWNRFNKIKIVNCNSGNNYGSSINGYIFIRNFYVDGRASETDNGIEISNSSKVILENCAVTRCVKSGVFVENSKIALSKGLVCYRNYAPSTVGRDRISGDWATKSYRNSFVSFDYAVNQGLGCGLLAVNSEINFFNTKFLDRANWVLDRNYVIPVLIGQPANEIFSPYYGAASFFNFSRNDYGILMLNSTLKGGNLSRNSVFNAYDYQALNCQLNTEAGFQLNNSVWDFDGKTQAVGNNYGFIANNSVVNLDIFICAGNWNTGLALNNSKALYNKNLMFPSVGINYNKIMFFANNGQNIYLHSSDLSPKLTLNIPSRYNEFTLSSNEGYDNPSLGTSGGSFLPSVELVNSKAILVHPKITKTTSNGEPLKGVVAAKSNSEIVIKGSKSYASRLLGPNTYANQVGMVGLYAGDNSKIKIEGPTVIAQFAIDALAENNSIIDIGPHRNSNNAGLDISGYNLADRDNHTMVELHSTRACLVVDKNSVLDIKDLGDYNVNWSDLPNGSDALLNGVNYNTGESGNSFKPYVSGGYLQFYPNPNDSNLYGGASVGRQEVTTATTASFQGTGRFRYYIGNYWNTVDGPINMQSTTGGGVCVRAVNQSKVNVLNTHFLTGWWNPSGIIYDASGFDTVELCNRLFIWNIADNSQIAAALVSVSGAHPIDVGYHGPKGVWTTSGLRIPGTELQLSTAPIGTPDTSSLSILDYYGACSGNPFGTSSFNNLGPFRLYFSTDPACTFLYNMGDNLALGLASQVFAQGYQLPGTFAFDPSISSTYISLLRRSSGGSLQASGFYYGSSMLFSPFTQRAILDESAANLFANAKHCSVGKSGLGRVVAINYPWNSTTVGDTFSGGRAGYGFRSPNTFDLSRVD